MGNIAAGPGWSLVVFLWIALALNYIDRQMVFSIFPALRADLHFTDTQLGLIGSVFTWIYALGMPIAGRLSDVLRRDRMILASLVLWSVATLACGFSGSVIAFLFWRGVMGITESLYYPAAVAMLAAEHPGPTRSKALGAHQSAQLAGIVAGGWYGGWMADNLSWRTGFMLAAAAGVVYSLVLARGLPASKAPATAASAFRMSDTLALARSGCYVALAAAFFAFCAMLWIFYAWFPSFLVERYGLSMTASGFNATISVQASCAVGVFVGGALADRLSKRIPGARFYVAAAGILLSAPFGYLTFAATSLDVTRLFAVAYGAFSGLMVSNVFAAACDVIPPQHYGLGAGLMNMTGGFAAAIMVFLAGLWKETLGFAFLMGWVAVACAVTAAILIAAARSRFSASGPDSVQAAHVR